MNLPIFRTLTSLQSDMSAFEKLPREIRDLIYEYCLLYDGEIVPFPRDYEREEIEKQHQVNNETSSCPPWEWPQTSALRGYSYVKREAFQTEDKPCVTLLGVNSTIRNEAASILFGKNTWRLSSKSYAKDAVDKYRFWETYVKYFRYVVTRFDARDVDGAYLLDISMGEVGRVEEDLDHFDQTGTANVHEEQLGLLRDGFIWKRSILLRMNLKSLSFDFSNLFCPRWCCRREALQSCFVFLGSTGPWYRLDQERDSETKIRTDVDIFGLKSIEEVQLFQETWDFKV